MSFKKNNEIMSPTLKKALHVQTLKLPQDHLYSVQKSVKMMFLLPLYRCRVCPVVYNNPQ